MNDTVERALALWGLAGAEYRLIAARENAVFQISSDQGLAALRLHRVGYRSDAELWSELQWMAAMANVGIKVPAPIAATSGDMLHCVNGVQVDVLTWLPGLPVQDKMPTLSGPERAALFFAIGQEMAKLHDACDAWTPPPGFTRCAWDHAGLLGDIPLWDRFWDNPDLTAPDKTLFLTFRDRASATLATLKTDLDYGLIHADLIGTNIMADQNNLHLIDFDDGGYGFRIFEVATALLKVSKDANFEALRAELIKGYRTIRPIDVSTLDLFMALRAATYVGWNITRLNEDGGHARNARFIATARDHAMTFLKA